MTFQRYSTDEVLTAAREGSALVKQSNETLTKAKNNSKFIREHISVILKHGTTEDIVIKTCSENDINRIQSLIGTVKDTNVDKNIQAEAKDYCKDNYGCELDSIIAFGALEKEATKSKLESYIDNVTITHRGFDKREVKKSFKCFANEDHHLKCNCIHVIHEDAGSSFNCLISTKLKYYNWGIIYKQVKD